MYRIMLIAIVAGLIGGTLVGGFHNLFIVPVMERAIVLEEERGAAEALAAGVTEEEGEPLVSLGMQRILMVVGLAVLTAIFGLLFTGGYWLTGRIVPNWHPMAIALVVGAIGFWTFSLFPFFKFPVNPPGVGDEATLLARQAYQLLTIFLSAAATIGVLMALKAINSAGAELAQRLPKYIGVGVAYAIFAVLALLLIPGNPDPVPVPIDLLELFRTLTMIGHFLQWMLLAAGVALFLMWRQKSKGINPSPFTEARNPRQLVR